jgi:hypothetical protein
MRCGPLGPLHGCDCPNLKSFWKNLEEFGLTLWLQRSNRIMQTGKRRHQPAVKHFGEMHMHNAVSEISPKCY